MKLTATVTAVSAKSGNRDGQRRVTLTVAEAEPMDRRFSVPSDKLQEDAELVLLVLTKEQAASIAEVVGELGDIAPQPLTALADQLRPDELPPWEQTTVADEHEAELMSIAEEGSHVNA